MKNHRHSPSRRPWTAGLAIAAWLLAGTVAAQLLPAPAIQPSPRLPQPSLAPPQLPASPTVQAIPAAQWTPDAIRQAFEQADTNSDGQLTRAEAQRLAIQPHSFEDMDENKDGLVDRAEYQRAFTH